MDGAQQITMSSQDIAELVEKRHDNVKRTIETLIVRGVITSPQIEEKPTAGRPATFYVFEGEKGKRDSIIVVAQLSPEFTARLVDRWQELEAKIATPTVNPLEALNDPTFLRDALLGYSEKVIALQGQVEEMKPDVITLEKLSGAEGSMTITLAAKNLQISPRALFDYLQHNGWIYRENGAWQPVWVAYQTKIDAGYLLQKVGSYEKGDGRIGVREQVRVTPKGLAKLGKLLSKNEN
ncbi:phage antirepressor KilAC domain-containing protein [Enterobacter soli]|uniref:phage antirepressor KilAC domain-containing protein n=1 Tax=Enterobacter soli TaxID=885040 RepID=UPI0039C88874